MEIKKFEDIFGERFPLHRACRDGDFQALAVLMESKPEDIYVEDCFYGWTPIHWAAYFGRLGCLQKLIAKTSTDLSCNLKTQKFNQIPLQLAAKGKHCSSLRLLLQAGGNVNHQDSLQETALHKAARTGCMECVSLLISYGADIRIKNNTYFTAEDVARSCNQELCRNYLQKAREIIQYQSEAMVSHTNHSLINGLSKQNIQEGLNAGHLPQGFKINDLIVKNDSSFLDIAENQNLAFHQVENANSQSDMIFNNPSNVDYSMDVDESSSHLVHQKQLTNSYSYNHISHSNNSFGLNGFSKKRLSTKCIKNDMKRARTDDTRLWEENGSFTNDVVSQNQFFPILSESHMLKQDAQSSSLNKDINSIPGKCFALRGHYL